MKIENSIGWCDETTNAVTGCNKISPGCKNCYAAVGTRARVLRAQGIETWGPGGSRMPVAGFQMKIRRLNKYCVCGACHSAGFIRRMRNGVLIVPGNECTVAACRGILRRPRVFADSNSDWLDPKWTVETLANFLNEIRLAPNVDVLLLTKRPENWRQRLQAIWNRECTTGVLAAWVQNWLDGDAPANVWIGVSVENQKYADERIPLLLQIPAAVRFLSCEPLLEVVDLDLHERNHKRGETIDWVIVGGESGKDRRDCGVEAIVSVAEQCRAAGVPIYVKQDCAFKSGEQGRIPENIWDIKQFPKAQKLQ